MAPTGHQTKKQLLSSLLTDTHKIKFYTVSKRIKTTRNSQVYVDVRDVHVRLVSGKGSMDVDINGQFKPLNQRIVIGAVVNDVKLSRFISYDQLIALNKQYPDIIRKPPGLMAR